MRTRNKSINFAPSAPDTAKLRRLLRRDCQCKHRGRPAHFTDLYEIPAFTTGKRCPSLAVMLAVEM